MAELKVVEGRKDWWACACFKGGSLKLRRPSTHFKVHHPSVKKCRKCGVTREPRAAGDSGQ